MDESSKVKHRNKKPKTKSPDYRNDPSSKYDKVSSGHKRSKHDSDNENPKKYARGERENSENHEPNRFQRYWTSKSENEDGELEKREKRYVPQERYWGGKDGRDNEHRKREKSDRFDEEKYLVGSRYYVDSRKNKKSPRPNNKKTTREENDKNSPSIEPPPPVKKKTDIITSRTGGAYIPPGKLKLMQASITDKSSAEYQRIAWEALKKSIHGHINKVNTSNIGVVARLLFKENIIRGRGLLCRSIIQAQSASVTFTNVYACLVSIINSKFPNIGELLLKRVIIRFKRAYKRNDKAVCISSATFIAHLINQRVAHEILGLELVTLLVENPTDDSIEVAVAFLKEAGQKLSEVTSKGTNAIFDMLRNILHEGQLEKRVQYMIEVMFQVRKDDFAAFPSVPEDLDLVDEEDQFTHLLSLDDALDIQDILNVFKMDSEFQANEEKYKELRGEILDTDSEGSGSGGSSSGEDGSEEEGDDDDDEQDEEKKMTIVDNTETNLVAFRKTIYLTIQSSLDFEECAHKLLKMEIKPGQEKELCHMFLDCCAEQRTYEKFFGLLSQRFCQVNKMFITPFEEIFAETYGTVHRLDTNRLRNVAKLFAHLLFTDAISWAVLYTIRLNEEDTTSSSRIFIKILFQELSEYMGLANLNSRLKDPTLQTSMEGLFPRDNPKNTRFAINFFTSIGLGGLTDELREHLKNLPKPVPVSQLIQELSSTSSSSSDDSSSDSADDSSSSSSSEEEKGKKQKKSKEKSKKVQEKKKSSKRLENNKKSDREHMNSMVSQFEERDNHKKRTAEEIDKSDMRVRVRGDDEIRNGADNRRQRHRSDEDHHWARRDEETSHRINVGNESQRNRVDVGRYKGRGEDERHNERADNVSYRSRGGGGDEKHGSKGGDVKHKKRGDAEKNRSWGDNEKHNYKGDSEVNHRNRGDYEKHRRGDNDESHRNWDDNEKHRNSGDMDQNNRNWGDNEKYRNKGDNDVTHRNWGDNEKHRNRGEDENHRSWGDNERHRNRGDDENHRGWGDDENQRNRGDKDKHRNRGDKEKHRIRGDDEKPRNRGVSEKVRSRGDDEKHKSKGEERPREKGACRKR